MHQLERLNRLLISCLLSLVFVQAGLIFYLKHLQDEAEYRLVKNTTKANLSCGRDQFSEDSYWAILDENVESFIPCPEGNCTYAHLMWNRPRQDRELHVISVEEPPPFDWDKEGDKGGSVKIVVKKTEKPQVLALIGQNYMEWKFEIEEGAVLEKVIVATPSLAWLADLPEGVEIEYLPKEKMCSYPYTWQEAFNPDNEFRSLLKALRQVSGLMENSFQGAKRGKEFSVPIQTETRKLASVEKEVKAPLPLSTKWKREQGRLLGDHFTYEGQDYLLPKGTKQVFQHTKSGRVFAIVKGLLQVWTREELKFRVLDTPVTLARLGFVESMAFDEQEQRLFVYNEQRSGELFAFDLEKSKWSLVYEGFSRNFTALHFDAEKRQLVGLVIKSSRLTELVYLDTSGKVLKTQPLKNRAPIDKKRWKWLMAQNDKGLWLHLATVQDPQGSWQQLY